MKVYNYPIASAHAMNADFIGSALQCYNMFGYCIQITITGTPTGTFKLQGSCDPVPQGSTSDPLTGGVPTNWTDIANSSESVTTFGSLLYDVSDVMYNWMRLIYTDGSGGTSSATFSARFNGKGV